MYVQLLAAVLAADGAVSCVPGELLSVARTSRHQMLTSTGHAHPSAERDLAYDVLYDCALIRLCAAAGIDSTPASFGRPLVERERLERALTAMGVDLAQVDVAR